MKSIAPKPHFSAHWLKVVNNESVAEDQSRSPYLKAILSGTLRPSVTEKDLSVTNPDRAAALRYIKESTVLRK